MLVGVGLTACSPRQLVLGSLADELASPALGSENDLILLRDAAPFHLKLSETVLQQQPGHLALATSVAAGFTQYAYAFPAFEADKIEALDAKGAEVLRRRAARLYERAHRHAMKALELQHPGFAARLADPSARWQIDPAELGLAYWAAASWGGWISLSKDDPEIVADLPLAVRLAEAAWKTDPAWGQGALSGLMGSFEAARPGGSAARALAYFDQALSYSAGQSCAALLGKAEGHALPGGDRPMFEGLLKQALAIKEASGSPLAVSNEVMRQRAAWLLSKADDLF